MSAYSHPFDERKLVEMLQEKATAHRAFETIVDIYTEPLYWQIRKMVPHHDDANDLLQNVFLKAWKNIHNFRGEAKLSTWLHKIAINESLNHIQQQKQKSNITDSSEDNFLLNSIEADEYIDGNQLELELQKAIASLPDKQKIVFNMRYFDEMKYEEISDILGTSIGALKASYHHAVKKICKWMGIEDK